jgi:hypothetical protein
VTSLSWRLAVQAVAQLADRRQAGRVGLLRQRQQIARDGT